MSLFVASKSAFEGVASPVDDYDKNTADAAKLMAGLKISFWITNGLLNRSNENRFLLAITSPSHLNK